MDDPLDEMARRLERIEQLLSQAAGASGAPRSMGSVARRLDDVWLATTEGNERTAATLAELGRRLAAVEAVAEELRTALADLDRQVASTARAMRRQRRSTSGSPPVRLDPATPRPEPPLSG